MNSLFKEILKYSFLSFVAQIIFFAVVTFVVFYSRTNENTDLAIRLTNLDSTTYEAIVFQNSINNNKARDLIAYTLLEKNKLSDVQILDNSKIEYLQKTLAGCFDYKKNLVCYSQDYHKAYGFIPIDNKASIVTIQSGSFKSDSFEILFKAIPIVILAAFLGNIFILFILWTKLIRPQLTNLIEAINHGETNDKLKIQEFVQIQNVFLDALHSARSIQKEKEAFEVKAKYVSLARQVAHDIRSPLSVLKFLNLKDRDFSRHLKSAIKRIDEVASSLLNTDKDVVSNLTPLPVNLYFSLFAIIKEKDVEFSNSIHFQQEVSSRELYSLIEESFLKNALSNLINNCKEAFLQRNIVTLRLYCQDDLMNILEVEDYGCGIPETIQDKVFTENFTTKKYGNGLGLSSLKLGLAQYNATVSFNSVEGKTTFKISIPKAEAPASFFTSLNVFPFSRIVVLDDDESIFSLIRSQFVKFEKEIIFFKEFSLFKDWLEISNDVFFLFCDQNLGELKGTEIIPELPRNCVPVLMTSDLTHGIVHDCMELNTTTLSKDHISLISILSEEIKVVLIDDDKYVRSAWEGFFNSLNVQFVAFENFDQFRNTNIDSNAHIFIDSYLSSIDRGETIAEKLFEDGYRELYITSSVTVELNLYPWIKGSINKNPSSAVKSIVFN
jgi:signal transduction histidine kinase